MVHLINNIRNIKLEFRIIVRIYVFCEITIINKLLYLNVHLKMFFTILFFRTNSLNIFFMKIYYAKSFLLLLLLLASVLSF
jgi:hypothetical protein